MLISSYICILLIALYKLGAEQCLEATIKLSPNGYTGVHVGLAGSCGNAEPWPRALHGTLHRT
jgi:hypothetical protein